MRSHNSSLAFYEVSWTVQRLLGLAEQFWDFNVSSWMPLSEVDDYLKNRRAKGFNIVQIRYCRIHAPNEGGYAFRVNRGEEPGN